MIWPKPAQLLGLIEPWLARQRWFPGSSLPAGTRVIAYEAIPSVQLDQVRQFVIDTGEGIFNIPLVLSERSTPRSLICEIPDGYLLDGAHHKSFWRAWLDLSRSQGLLGRGTDLEPSALYLQLYLGVDNLDYPHGEQSNTSVSLKCPSLKAQAKLYRRLYRGLHPEVEMSTKLYEAGWHGSPTPLAWSVLRVGEGEPFYTAFVNEFIPRARDGFELFTQRAAQDKDSQKLAFELGESTAQMHLLLGQAFGKGPRLETEDLASQIENNLKKAVKVCARLKRSTRLQDDIRRLAKSLVGFSALPHTFRIHGDFHLGQCVHAGKAGWFILDFEGPVDVELPARRRYESPLADVAAMLNSFDYALAKSGSTDETWLEAVRQAYLEGYFSVAQARSVDRVLVRAYEVNKALYEVRYEAQYRPDWIDIPLNGLRKLTEE